MGSNCGDEITAHLPFAGQLCSDRATACYGYVLTTPTTLNTYGAPAKSRCCGQTSERLPPYVESMGDCPGPFWIWQQPTTKGVYCLDLAKRGFPCKRWERVAMQYYLGPSAWAASASASCQQNASNMPAGGLKSQIMLRGPEPRACLNGPRAGTPPASAGILLRPGSLHQSTIPLSTCGTRFLIYVSCNVAEWS